MINVKYYDNGEGTIIKTLVENGSEKTYAYDILVGKNIPKEDSIVDYCYSQFEDNLKTELSRRGIPTNEFCSGTCVAMALAITYGDKTITPLSVLLWGGDEAHPETCTANWGANGLLKWEQEDYDSEDTQMYDNRVGEKYQAVDDSFMENNDEYLKNLKIYLSAGLPVIIRVNNHFMVAVGVESDVKLEDATLDQLVVFDPNWTAGVSDENKIVTFKQSGRYKENNRMLTPYPINSAKMFVTDETGAKTHDPYYIDPVTKADGSIVPAYAGRPLKEAIAAVNNSLMSQEDKDNKIAGLIKLFTGDDGNVYEDLTAVRNGEHLPGDGVTAFKKVTVNVPIAALGISENGEYHAADRNVAAFDPVTVNVSDRYDEGYNAGRQSGYEEGTQEALNGSIKPLSVTANGTYTAADYEGKGFDPVNVNVPGQEEIDTLKKQLDDAERYLSDDDKPVYMLLKGKEVTTTTEVSYTYRIRYDATDTPGDPWFERDRFSVFVTNNATGKTYSDWTTIFNDPEKHPAYNTQKLADCFYVENDIFYYRFGGGSYYVGMVENWRSMNLNF